jgi:hypothetical protein
LNIDMHHTSLFLVTYTLITTNIYKKEIYSVIQLHIENVQNMIKPGQI